MGTQLDYSFEAMGSDIRLVIGDALLRRMPPPLEAADRERAFVWDFSDRLSRFRADSALSRLNHDPRAVVPADPLLRAAVGAGLWAAEYSGGLVDPTLVQALERTGYDRSLDGCTPASLTEALAVAPARRPAEPDPAARWRQIEIDDAAGTITRPPGVMLDTGGTGKGLCADAVALHLGGYTRFVVDCGGDIAIGGVGPQLRPFVIEVEHPLTGASIGSIRVRTGGIATSGLNVRIWKRRDGSYAHHLLDPSTGEPVWSGIVGATALGASALEAETRSKMALLLGPAGAREVLAEHGGVIIHDTGETEVIGPVDGQFDAVGVEVGAGAGGTMTHPAPLSVLWWLVSRASGILALVLISASVVLGLAMAAKVIHRPAVKRAVVRLHEHIALISLVAIAVHGLALLGDHWLKPGLRGIVVPFALGYRPGFTGIGIIAGYLAVLVGPSFYVRRRIGVKRWRKLHRFTVVVWGLGVVHALGAGSDGGTPWLRAVVLAPLPVIVYLLVVRSLHTSGPSAPVRAHSSEPRVGAGGPRAASAPARSSHRRAVHGQLEHEPSPAA